MGAADRAEQGPQEVSMTQSVAGAPAEGPAPVSSQASARGGLAGRAAEK